MRRARADDHRPAGGRVAVVTGASRGIGAAIARRMGTDGYLVILVATDRDALDNVRADITQAGGDAETWACDLGDRSALERLGAELQRSHPVISALVHNAGIVRAGSLAEFGGANWDDVLELNVRVPLELTRLLEPALAAASNDGTPNACVVNVGSVMGILATPGIISYVASKGALHHMTRGLALELGPRNIRVNAIAPGFIRTDMFETSHPPERQAALGAAHPIGRVGNPEEIAAAVSFLCSADASFISGAVIPVDGGLTARLAVPDIV